MAGVIALTAGVCEKDANAQGVRIDDVEVGIKGFYKVGDWTPITVTATTDRPLTLRLVVDSTDPGGHNVTQPVASVTLSEPGEHRVGGIYKSGRLESPVTVRLVENETVQASRTLRSTADDEQLRAGLLQSTLLVLTLGKPAGFDSLKTEFPEGNSTPSVEIVELDDAAALPRKVEGLAALDVIVIAGRYDEIDAAQGRVLDDWLHRGGHLILAVGEETDPYRRTLLAEWIPISVVGQTTHTQLSGLESFSKRNIPIAASRLRVSGAKIDATGARVLVSGRDGPLVADTPYGFGRVTFVSIDMDRPPLSQWKALPEFIARLLGLPEQSAQEQRPRQSGGLTNSGISDLATQLHAVQDHFPAIGRLSTVPVMGLLIVYMVLIGPVDYWIVHRLLRRPQLTWVTFPVLVVGAAVVSAWGAATSNGETSRLNQLAIVDADEQSGYVRSNSWQTLYGRRTARHAINLQPLSGQWRFDLAGNDSPSAVENQRFAWAGIPENSFGGMYRVGGSALAQPGYHMQPGTTSIEDLPVTVWTSKSLEATWQHRDLKITESRLESVGLGRLQGTFAHALPVPLTDWILAFRNRLYFPKVDVGTQQRPNLPPRQKFRINARTVDQRVLVHFLTGTVVVENESNRGDQFLAERSEYDALSRDPESILRVLTFYDFLDGKNYTKLDNHALRELDLSGMLEMDRAVLLGWIPHAAARVEVDGEPIEPEQPRTCVRVVMPVRRVEEVELSQEPP